MLRRTAAAALLLALLAGTAPAQFAVPGYAYGYYPAAVAPAPAVAVYNPYVGYSFNPYFAGTYSPYVGYAYPRLSLYRNYYAYPYYPVGTTYSYTSTWNPVIGQAVSVYSSY